MDYGLWVMDYGLFSKKYLYDFIHINIYIYLYLLIYMVVDVALDMVVVIYQSTNFLLLLHRDYK